MGKKKSERQDLLPGTLTCSSSKASRAALYGVTCMDAVAFVTAPAIVLLMTLAAAWLPAGRAARLDSLVALLAE